MSDAILAAAAPDAPSDAVAAPLSRAQLRIRAHARVGGLGPFRIERAAARLAHDVSEDALAQARVDLLARHPGLALRIEAGPGDAPRAATDPAPARLRIETADDPAARLKALLAAARPAPEGPGAILIAVRPAPGASGGIALGVALHPILGDAEAALIALEDFAALLSGARLAPAIPVEDAPLSPETRGARLAAARAALSETHPARLPPTVPGAEPQPFGIRAFAARALSPALTRALRAEGARMGLSPADCIAALLAAALARTGGGARLRMALLDPCRDGPGLSRLIARREDLAPLALSLAPAADLRALLAEFACARAEEADRRLPSELLLQDALDRPGAPRRPLGAAVLAARRAPALPPGAEALVLPEPAAHGDLCLTVTPAPDGGLSLVAAHDPGLLTGAMVGRLLDHVERLAEALATAPATLLRDVALVDAEELAALSAPYPDDAAPDPRPVHRMIAEAGAGQPGALAVIHGETRLTHAELERGANRIAHALIAMGVGPEKTVAIALEKGAEAIMAILGALKAGGAYVPVEPTHPESRNAHILADCGAVAIVTRSRWLAALPPSAAAPLLLDEPVDGPDHDPMVPIHDGQLAYVMYTSGSTGKPKGVGVEHGPLTRHNQATARVYEMHPESRELPFLPFSSDGGHERWMVPLMMGGSVLIPDGALWTPEQTLAGLRDHGCDNASIPTTYMHALAEWAEATGSAPQMRLYSFGGEGLARATFDLISRALPAKILINGYGPTETIMTPMVWKTVSGAPFDGPYAPLGRAVGLRRAYVLDADLMPCPIGVPGEIHLGGDGVARGYLNRPGTTADRFIPDHLGPMLGDAPGGRLYRSGDLGRWREDGTIEFIGRVDHQVKLNGHRIEPGEIEAALLLDPTVAEALCLLREDDGRRALVAYVVPAAGAEASEDALMRRLETALPRHMVPSAVMVIPKMPINPNAKLDRAALPRPGAPKRGAGVPPEGPLETLILRIFREVLGAPEMGVTDDFFAMGGRSILALRALHALKQARPGDRTGVAEIFSHPTPRALAARIEAGKATSGQAVILRAGGTKPRLYCFPGLLVSTREYMALTEHLGPERPVTGFLCQSLSEDKSLAIGPEQVVADYVAHIRAENRGGPCAFLGWSWGGLLAWEAARQLKGEIDLRMIGMVDVCDLGTDFAEDAPPSFAPGERETLLAAFRDWQGKTRMRAEWDALLSAMDPLMFDQFLKFIGNEAEPLPHDGPEIGSREHTFRVLIDNAMVFRRHRPGPLDAPVRSWTAEDSLSRGLSLIDWRRLSPRAGAAELVPGADHLTIIGDRMFHARLKAALAETDPVSEGALS